MRGGQYHWLLIFLFLCAGIILFSLGVGDSSAVQTVLDGEGENGGKGRYRDYFKDVRYYYFLWGEREKRFHLSADELLNDVKSDQVEFLNPRGMLQLKGERSLLYRGGQGRFDISGKELQLEGNVSFSDDKTRITCSQAIYKTRGKELKLKGNVEGLTRFGEYKSSIRIGSQEALAWPLLGKVRYLGEVRGDVESPRDQGQKLLFSSGALDLDLYRHHLDISQDVVFKRERFVAAGNRGEIFWNRESKNVEHYILHDNIKLKEKVEDEDGFFERSALAEKMEGAFGDYHIVLTGRPRVVQREDVIEGNRIVLKKDSDIVEVDGASANFRLGKQKTYE